ncbi:MAG TPA: hypothetical protein VGL94_17995 [Ktedonobacteraceae bacterium]|jgi:chromosome segregation ATPase
MNQPTEDRIKRLEEEQRQLKEEVRKLKEQMTEPITIPRIELDPGGIQNRLDNHAEMLREISQKQDKQDKQLTLISTDMGELKIDTKAFTGDAAIFKNKVERVESDVSTLKSDVGTLKTDMGQVKTDVGTIKTIQNGHSKFFEEHGRRLSQIETSMTTKDDIGSIKNDIGRLERIMMQILNRLPKTEGE